MIFSNAEAAIIFPDYDFGHQFIPEIEEWLEENHIIINRVRKFREENKIIFWSWYEYEFECDEDYVKFKLFWL